LLELFALLTLGLLVASIAGLLLLLAWDNMLSGLASATELEFEGSALDFNEDLRKRSSEATTDFIQTLSTNAFRACGGTVVVAGAAANASYVLGDELGSGSPALEGSSFTLRCNNDASNMLGSIGNTCLVGKTINATVGSRYHDCYNGTWFPSWPALHPIPPYGLVDSLNTPKGLFCACSTTFIEDYALWLTRCSTYFLISAAVFFFVVLLVAVHQLAQRCRGAADASLLEVRERVLTAHGSRRMHPQPSCARVSTISTIRAPALSTVHAPTISTPSRAAATSGFEIPRRGSSDLNAHL